MIALFKEIKAKGVGRGVSDYCYKINLDTRSLWLPYNEALAVQVAFNVTGEQSGSFELHWQLSIDLWQFSNFEYDVFRSDFKLIKDTLLRFINDVENDRKYIFLYKDAVINVLEKLKPLINV
jgi:hypothetical protein